jgi:hypothetical protein
MSPKPESAPEPDGDAAKSRAEQVLAQTLNVMAGGKPAQLRLPEPTTQRRLNAAQLVLIASIIGLLVGVGAGLLSLVW